MKRFIRSSDAITETDEDIYFQRLYDKYFMNHNNMMAAYNEILMQYDAGALPAWCYSFTWEQLQSEFKDWCSRNGRYRK